MGKTLDTGKKQVEDITLDDLKKMVKQGGIQAVSAAGQDGKKTEKTGKVAQKDGKAASKGKAPEKGGKASGKRRVRRPGGDKGKDKGSVKKNLVSPIALQKVFGNERFNQEFRAAIMQDTTPEDLTDEELMEFLCDAMEQCFEHCREEEVEELEELADILGLEVTHEDPGVDLQKEKEKVLRREMTRELGIK